MPSTGVPLILSQRSGNFLLAYTISGHKTLRLPYKSTIASHWDTKVLSSGYISLMQQTREYSQGTYERFGALMYNYSTVGNNAPHSKVHGANMGPTWVLSAPGGPHVGLMNLAICGITSLGNCDMNKRIHIHQGNFSGNGTIIRTPWFQWYDCEEYG